MNLTIQNVYGSFGSVNTSGAFDYEVSVPNLSNPDVFLLQRNINASSMAVIDNITNQQKVSDYMGNNFAYVKNVERYVRFNNTDYAQKKYPAQFRAELGKYMNSSEYNVELEKYAKAIKHYILLKHIEMDVMAGRDVLTLQDIEAYFKYENIKAVDKLLKQGTVFFDSSIIRNVKDAIQHGNAITLQDIDADIASIQALVKDNLIVRTALSNPLPAHTFKSTRKGPNTEYPLYSMDIAIDNSELAKAKALLSEQNGRAVTDDEVYEVIKGIIREWASSEPVPVGDTVNISPNERAKYAQRTYAISDLQTSGSASQPHFHVLVGAMFAYKDPLTGLTIIDDLDRTDFEHSHTRLASKLSALGLTLNSINAYSNSTRAVIPTVQREAEQEEVLEDDVLDDVLDEEFVEETEKPIDLAAGQSVKQLAKKLGAKSSQYKDYHRTINNAKLEPLFKATLAKSEELNEEERVVDSEIVELEKELAEKRARLENISKAKEVCSKEINTFAEFELLIKNIDEVNVIIEHITSHAPMLDNAMELYGIVGSGKYPNLIDTAAIDAQLLAELQESNPDATDKDISGNARSEAYNNALFLAMEDADGIHQAVESLLTNYDVIPHEKVAEMQGMTLPEKLEVISQVFDDVYKDNIEKNAIIIDKNKSIADKNTEIDELKVQVEQLEKDVIIKVEEAIATTQATALEDKKNELSKVRAVGMVFPGELGDAILSSDSFDSLTKSINNAGNALSEQVQKTNDELKAAKTENKTLKANVDLIQQDLDNIVKSVGVDDATVAVIHIEGYKKKAANYSAAVAENVELKDQLEALKAQMAAMVEENAKMVEENAKLLKGIQTQQQIFTSAVGKENAAAFNEMDNEGKKDFLRQVRSQLTGNVQPDQVQNTNPTEQDVRATLPTIQEPLTRQQMLDKYKGPEPDDDNGPKR